MQKLLTEVSLDGKWTQVTGDNTGTTFFIGAKDATAKTISKLAKAEDFINPEDVTRIYLEVGVESGIDGKYLTVDHICLNFDEFSSDDEEVNKLTTFTTRQRFYKSFYIKPVKLVMKDGKSYTAGKCAVSVNINVI